MEKTFTFNLMATACLFLFMGLGFGLSVSAATLDTKGQWSATCKAGTLASHSFDRPNAKASYSFSGQCVESAGGNVSNRIYQVKAGWNGVTKTANEDLSVTFWNGHYAGSVNYSCPDDPWLHSVNCTVTGKAGDIFNFFQIGSNPISAGFLSLSQKQSLTAEWNQQPAIATPQAPVILSPGMNQHFIPPVNVPIKVQHNPALNVAFEFQRSDFVNPPIWANQNVNINPKAASGITTGELAVGQPGKWRVRSQNIFPGAPWSNWVEFSAETLKLSPGMKDLNIKK
jgi:hypothetical protein